MGPGERESESESEGERAELAGQITRAARRNSKRVSWRKQCAAMQIKQHRPRRLENNCRGAPPRRHLAQRGQPIKSIPISDRRALMR